MKLQLWSVQYWMNGNWSSISHFWQSSCLSGTQYHICPLQNAIFTSIYQRPEVLEALLDHFRSPALLLVDPLDGRLWLVGFPARGTLEDDEEWWAGSDHHGRVLPHRVLVLILAKIRNNTICCKIYFPLRSFLSLISTLVLKLTNDD